MLYFLILFSSYFLFSFVRSRMLAEEFCFHVTDLAMHLSARMRRAASTFFSGFRSEPGASASQLVVQPRFAVSRPALCSACYSARCAVGCGAAGSAAKKLRSRPRRSAGCLRLRQVFRWRCAAFLSRGAAREAEGPDVLRAVSSWSRVSAFLGPRMC